MFDKTTKRTHGKSSGTIWYSLRTHVYSNILKILDNLHEKSDPIFWEKIRQEAHGSPLKFYNQKKKKKKKKKKKNKNIFR